MSGLPSRVDFLVRRIIIARMRPWSFCIAFDLAWELPFRIGVPISSWNVSNELKGRIRQKWINE